jgi:HAMP domain-containing protein
MVLTPCLLFSAAVSGWVTYKDLYDVILNDGFEQKLEAVSTGVAAFIDGDTHLALSRPTRLTGIAADPSKPLLWGLDSANDRLVTIDVTNGGATPLDTVPVSGLSGLTYDAGNARLLSVRPATGELFAFAPSSVRPVLVGHVQPGARALAIDASGKHLVVAGPWGLRGYTLAGPKGAPTQTWTSETSVEAVAVSPRTGALYGLRGDGSVLVADSLGAPLREVGVLKSTDDEGDPGQLHEVRALAASPVAPTVFAAGRRLMEISLDDLTVEAERFRRGYRNENLPTYQEYVVPMRRIRDALDITYLYTQNLVPGDSIEYVIDSTPFGPDYSPIGSREALDTEADVRGMDALMERGSVYSSRIEYSPEWGLLKSAFAPILGHDGRSVGMVGTDISVSTIRDRTQLALAKVGLVTVVILFLGGLGSLAISLRLAGPLAALQEGATRVAAGRAGEPIELPRLRDLAALTSSFNEMTDTLTSLVDELHEETSRVESMRTRRHLARELARRAASADPLPDGVSVEWRGPSPHAPAPSGFAVVGEPQRPFTAVWLRPEGPDALAGLADREETALLARRAAEAEPASPEALLSALERLHDGEGFRFVVVDAVEGRVIVSAGSPVRAVLASEGGRERPVDLAPGQAFRVPSRSALSLVLGSPGAGDAHGPAWVLRMRGATA